MPFRLNEFMILGLISPLCLTRQKRALRRFSEQFTEFRLKGAMDIGDISGGHGVPQNGHYAPGPFYRRRIPDSFPRLDSGVETFQAEIVRARVNHSLLKKAACRLPLFRL